MSSGLVLVVDDDAPIRRMLERTLTVSGFEVVVASDGGGALAAIERVAPDVLVLDVAMPGLGGLAVTRRVRAKGLAFPILLLTARDAITDRVEGLGAGADDYLVKPFAVEELVARLDALLRRGRVASETLAVRDVRLEVATGRAERGGRALHLTPREADVLAVLMRAPGQLITRDRILDLVWQGSASTSNVADRYIAYLRAKLGEPPLIATVRGSGFVFGPR